MQMYFLVLFAQGLFDCAQSDIATVILSAAEGCMHYVILHAFKIR